MKKSEYDVKKHLSKIIKPILVLACIYFSYWLLNIALIFVDFPGVGTYDFLSGNAVEKQIRWKFIQQMSFIEKIITFSTKIESSNLNEAYYIDINNTQVSEIDAEAVRNNGMCSFGNKYGSWHAGVWTATITGEKKHYTFTCEDGFQQMSDKDYILTLD